MAIGSVNIQGNYGFLTQTDGWTGEKHQNDVIIATHLGVDYRTDTGGNSINWSEGTFNIGMPDVDVGNPITYRIEPGNHCGADYPLTATDSGGNIFTDISQDLVSGGGALFPSIYFSVNAPTFTSENVVVYLDDAEGGLNPTSTSGQLTADINDGYGGTSATVLFTEFAGDIFGDYGTWEWNGDGSYAFEPFDETNNHLNFYNIVSVYNGAILSSNQCNSGLITYITNIVNIQFIVYNLSYIPYEYGCTDTMANGGYPSLNYYCDVNSSNDGTYCVDGSHTEFVLPCNENAENDCCIYSPSVDFDFTQPVATELKIKFTNKTIDPNNEIWPDGETLTYTFSYDPYPSSGGVDSYTDMNYNYSFYLYYDSPGEKTLSLNVTDLTGNSRTVEKSLTISLDGCTDQRADNHNAFANEDDGTCTYVGCFYTADSVSNYFCDEYPDAYICNDSNGYSLQIGVNAFDNNTCTFSTLNSDNLSWLSNFVTNGETDNYSPSNYTDLDAYLLNLFGSDTGDNIYTDPSTGYFNDISDDILNKHCTTAEAGCTDTWCEGQYGTLMFSDDCDFWCTNGSCDNCETLLNEENFPCDDIYYGSWCVSNDYTLTDECKYTLEYPSVYLKNGAVNRIGYPFNEELNIDDVLSLSLFNEDPNASSGDCISCCGQYTDIATYESCLSGILATPDEGSQLLRYTYRDSETLDTDFSIYSGGTWIGFFDVFSPTYGYEFVSNGSNLWLKFIVPIIEEEEI